MGLTNAPSGVSSYGVPLIGGAPFMTTGNVYWVHVSGDSAYTGLDPDRPLDTIDAAINKCTAASSTRPAEDTIIVMPGHAETGTAAAAFDLDVAGVTIIGLGRGSLRPTITLGTATTCDTDVGANGTALVNLLYVAALDSLAACLDIDATTGFLGEALEFRDASSIGIVDTVTITDETDIVFRNCRWYETDTGIGQSAILGTTPTRLIVEGCSFYKDAQTGVVECGNAVDARITDNYIETIAAEDLAVVFGSTGSGWIHNNMIRLKDDAANVTECIVGADMNLGRNWVVNADGERVMEQNTTQTTD